MGMLRVVVTGLVIGIAVAGCGGAVVKECENGCPRGQKCDTSTGICVKDAEPTVSVESIPNPLITTRLSLRGTTTDDIGVTKGEAFFEGQPPVAFTVADNAFTVELDVPQLDSAEGAVIVRVFDTAEQKAETRLSTTVDIVGPTVAISEPSRVIGGASVTVTGSSQDGSGEIALVQADFGSGATTATIANDNSWSVQLAPPAGRDVEETPISVRAKDKYGNETTTQLSVTVDSKGPTFSLTAPTGTVGGMSVEVAGTTTDTSGTPTSVSVRFGGLTQDVSVVDGGFTATVMLPQDLDGATRPVTFTAVDRFGNSGSQDFDVTIDTRGPILTLTGPAVVGATGTLTGTAVDSALPLSNVTVNVQGSAGPVPVDSLMNGMWTLAVAFPAGIDGVTRSVALSGRDARGNVGSGTGSFIVDTVGPVGSFTSPAANARLTGSTASFSGAVTDTTSVQSVELDFADGQGFRAATLTGNTWTISVPLSATEDEVSHLVTARFTDGVGNSSTVTRTVTVDNVGPTVAVTSPAASAVVGGTATTIAVAVSAVDPGGVAAVSVALGTGAAVAATRQGSTNTWTATVSLPSGQDFVTIPLRATATDAAGNTRSTSVDIIVDNVAPVLTITSPTANQVFNVSNFTASGNVTISWTVTDGDPQASVKTVGGVNFSGPGTSTTWPTVTTDNYVPYSVAVVASDRMNNGVTRNATFTVDRVAPTVSISPANGSRNADPRSVTFTFSEEMSGTPADPLVLTPMTSAPAGAWQGTTRTQFVRTGLEPYTVFTATTASGVTDRAGNPVTVATSRFHTSAQLPMNGAAIAGSVWAYDVASDPDGLPMVITVTQTAPNYNYATYQMSGTTGQFAAWSFAPTAQASVRGYQAYAWRTVNADLTATPIRGAWEDGTETVCSPSCVTQPRTRRAYAIGAASPTVELFGNLVPSPPISSADGTDPIGFFNGQTYTRNPGVTAGLGLTPARVAPGSLRWNVAAAPSLLPPTNTSAEVWVSSYTCTGVGFPLVQYYCFPVASQVINDAAPAASWARTASATENMSLATAENGCTLLSYPSVSSGRRIARINDTNSRAPCAGTCLYSLTTTFSSAPTADFVVGKGAGNTLLGVGTGGGGAQLYQTTDCGTWTAVGSPVAGATEAKPGLVGARPGFFYLDASRTLRVHVP